MTVTRNRNRNRNRTEPKSPAGHKPRPVAEDRFAWIKHPKQRLDRTGNRSSAVGGAMVRRKTSAKTGGRR